MLTALDLGNGDPCVAGFEPLASSPFQPQRCPSGRMVFAALLPSISDIAQHGKIPDDPSSHRAPSREDEVVVVVYVNKTT